MPLSDLVNKGYFPRELPPPFTTTPLANLVAAGGLPPGFAYVHGARARVTQATEHNLARAGSLRRKLSAPNPIGFIQVANTIYSDWAAISTKFSTAYSISTPTLLVAGSDRAIAPARPFGDIAIRRIAIRAGARFGLKTDVNTFYPSLYTHAIPWAVEGKAVAKAARHAPTLGNILDIQTRNAQDSQTVGIPIGPDTSLVIAELVLSVVDNELAAKAKARGFRFLDDYEFAFRSYTDAERVLATLQNVLSEFELVLNPRKSQIFELPAPSEEPFAGDLRTFHFRGLRNQSGDLRAYFDKAFGFARAYPDGSAIKYAISRLSRIPIHPGNWPLYENLLLQAATAEPGCLPFVVSELYKHSAIGVLDTPKIADVLHYLISLHAPIDHGSEVVWGLWGCKLLGLPVPDAIAQIVGLMRDNFVALVALDLQRAGLISAAVPFAAWRTAMTANELNTENWLLAYEANVKGWLPSVSGVDYVAADPEFGPLKAANVFFYDTVTKGPDVLLTSAPYSDAADDFDASEEEDEDEEDDDNIFGTSP